MSHTPFKESGWRLPDKRSSPEPTNVQRVRYVEQSAGAVMALEQMIDTYSASDDASHDALVGKSVAGEAQTLNAQSAAAMRARLAGYKKDIADAENLVDEEAIGILGSVIDRAQGDAETLKSVLGLTITIPGVDTYGVDVDWGDPVDDEWTK